MKLVGAHAEGAPQGEARAQFDDHDESRRDPWRDDEPEMPIVASRAGNASATTKAAPTDEPELAEGMRRLAKARRSR